ARCAALTITCVFFFSSRRRHTRCYRDWSSDVCSSDLLLTYRQAEGALGLPVGEQVRAGLPVRQHAEPSLIGLGQMRQGLADPGRSEERRVGKGGRQRWSVGHDDEVEHTEDRVGERGYG